MKVEVHGLFYRSVALLMLAVVLLSYSTGISARSASFGGAVSSQDVAGTPKGQFVVDSDVSTTGAVPQSGTSGDGVGIDDPRYDGSVGAGTTIRLPFITKGWDRRIETVSALIDAETGGSITLGQTTLSIPPGALSEDTMVSLGRPVDAPDVGERGVGYLRLEPTGIIFNTPATLEIGYVDPLTFEEGWLNAAIFDELEATWEILNVLSRDTANNRIVVEVNHFSYITTIFDRPIELVLYLPGEYLRKGDLIYTLALTEGNSKFTWIPGHVGLYLGTNDADSTSNDGETIIESTPAAPKSVPGCSILGGGVTTGTLTAFVEDGAHLYMGARRLDGVSSEDRTKIAKYALSNTAMGYSLVGQGNVTQGLQGFLCYSCVGLTEASYDWSGQSIIPPLLEWPFILPLEQFIRTQPVDEITVQAGDVVEFDAKRIYDNPVQEQYVRDSGRITIEGCPSGATCEAGHVDWPTTSGDVGDHVLTFSTDVTLSNGETYYATQALTITVVGTSDLVTMDQVSTTDYWGTAKSMFRPGEAIKLALRAANHTNDTMDVTYTWATYDPNEAEVDYLSYDGFAVSMPPGEDDWHLTRAIAKSALQGFYTYNAHVFYDASHDASGTSFVVEGEPISINFLEALTCRNVQGGKPVDVTNTFTPADEYVYAWSAWEGASGPHTLTWEWYKPDGTSFYTFPYDFDPAEDLQYVWTWMPVSSLGADFGQWHIDVYMDGTYVQTVYFTFQAGAQSPMDDQPYSFAPDAAGVGGTRWPLLQAVPAPVGDRDDGVLFAGSDESH